VPPSTSRTGSAGAFHTSPQLAQRRWDASLTLGNAPRTDILAQHAESQRLIAVQCKTSTGNQDFILKASCETPAPLGRDEWFVFVTLWPPDRRPDFYVMPRNVVAAYLYVGYHSWLTGPKRDGTPRRENDTRNVELLVAEPYRERWDLLEQPADTAPCWLPDWVFEREPHTGLPSGHPGITVPADAVARPDGPPWALSLPPLPATRADAVSRGTAAQ
jgi:hypothetical protein